MAEIPASHPPMAQGADFYITKPFDAEEMLAVVRRFVRNGDKKPAA